MRFVRQQACAAKGGAEEGRFPVLADAGRSDVGVEIGFEVMMRRHLVALAAFLVQPHPPAFPLRVVVLDAHADDGADAREGIGHYRDQGTVAQADKG
jgi:hypothetical protein